MLTPQLYNEEKACEGALEAYLKVQGEAHLEVTAAIMRL